LAGLSIAEWISLAETVLPLGEDAIGLLAQAHPALSAFAAVLNKSGSTTAAAQAADYYFANQPPTISGYGPDGGIMAIPNPDYRG
jgi:hypothetical protein